MRTRLVAALCAALAILPLAAPAQASVTPATSQVCTSNGNQSQIYPVTSPNGHVYEFSGNEYNSNAPYKVCSDGGTSFTVESSSLDTPTGSAPAAYASIYRGNHGYGAAISPRSGLPIPAADFTSTRDPVHLSMSATLPRAGVWDLDFDTFFTPPGASRPGPQTEIMVFLDSRGVTPGSELATDVRIGSHTFDVYGSWTNAAHTVALVIYVLTAHRTSVTGLGYGPFVAYTENLGFLPAGWALADVEAGFELWRGGKGAQVNSYAVCDPAGC
jgi:hypothetical protein